MQINEKMLIEYKISDWGDCTSIIVNSYNSIGVVCKEGSLFLGKTYNNGAYVITSFKTTVSDSPFTFTEKLPIGVRIADIKISTSEGTIFLSDGSKIHLQLIRDNSTVTPKFYGVTLETRAEFIKSGVE